MSRVPAEVRRAQLIEATIDVAIEEGLAAASIRRIADAAGVSLGVVHYCFSSKEALLDAVAESFVDPILGPVSEVIAATTGDPVERRAEAALRAYWAATQSGPGRQLLSYELTAWSVRGDGEAARLLYETYTRAIMRFLEVLGIGDDTALPLRTLARMVLTITDGTMLAWLVDRDETQAQEVLTAFLRMLLRLVTREENERVLVA